MATSSGLQAIEALRDAATAVGLAAETAPSGSGADLELVNPAGGRVLAQVKRVSLASADTVGRQLDPPAHHPLTDSPVVVVLVADRVTEHARQQLRDAGGSWLDLRGHLHLVGRHLFVDADIPRLTEAPGQPAPLTGQVGQEVAAIMLLDPTTPASVRDVARRLNRSASSVSQAIASMRAAELVDSDRRPVIPDLFWELAERWHPVGVDLQAGPSPAVAGLAGATSSALRLGLDDIETTTGWALSDTMAAAAYGAPVAARSDHPPDFYVPDQTVMRRATQLLGSASSHDGRGAIIRLAPFPLVCAHRIGLPRETWPLARPLFVALDLAGDPDRGRAILANWTPPAEVGSRVW